jgi:hypothetical protein
MGALFLVISNGRYFVGLLIAMVIFAASALAHSVSDGRLESLSADLQWGARALLMLTYYMAFSELLRRGAVGARQMLWVSVAGWGIVGTNLIIGMAGFGFAQYDNRFGTAGFFYAGNELAVLMVALGVLPLAYTYTCRTVGVYVVTAGLLMLAALFTLTKTAIAGLLLLSLFIPAIDLTASMLRSAGLTRQPVRYIGAALVITVTALIAAWWFVKTTGFLDRVVYFLDKGGWSAIIFSGRDRMVEGALAEFLRTSGGLGMLTGRGVLWLNERFGGQTESDLVDFGIAFGLPVAVIAFGALAITSFRSATIFFIDPEYRLLAGASAVFGLLAIVIAATAGHVLNSGTAAATIGAVLATWRVGVITAKELRWRV